MAADEFSPAWNRHVRHSRSDGCGRLKRMVDFTGISTPRKQLVVEATAAALDTLLDTLASAASGKKGRKRFESSLSGVRLRRASRQSPRWAVLWLRSAAKLARSDKRVRDVATTGFFEDGRNSSRSFLTRPDQRKRGKTGYVYCCCDDRCRNNVARTDGPEVVQVTSPSG